MIVAYIRKSSEDKNKQVLSLDDQILQCKEIAKRYNFKIDEFFVEAKTGWKADARTEFYRMLELIKSGQVDTVVCWNLDRIGRNGQDNGTIRDLITHGELKIITATTIYDTNNTLQTGFENLINEEFSNKLSKVVKARLKLKAERGEYPNQAPIGYLNTPKRLKGVRVILPDTKRWELCRKWWELMITGIYTVEESLGKITEMGLAGKNNKPISRTKAFKFFRDIFYTGNFVYGGTTYPGNHKPMISMAEFVKVQQLLDSKGKKGADTILAPREKTFQGMLKCGECGAAITMERKNRYYKNGTSQEFWYYRCTKKKGPCSQPYLNANLFEPQLKSYISQLELNPKYAELIKKVLKRRNANEFAMERKQLELKTKRLLDITSRKKNLYGMKIDGLFSEEEYQKQKRDILIEEKQLRESYIRPHTTYWEGVIDNAINFATAVTQLFGYGDIFTRQMVLRILGSNLYLTDKKVKIEAKKAFIFLRDVQNETFKENLWLEPKNVPMLGQKVTHFENESRSVPRRGVEPPRGFIPTGF